MSDNFGTTVGSLRAGVVSSESVPFVLCTAGNAEVTKSTRGTGWVHLLHFTPHTQRQTSVCRPPTHPLSTDCRAVRGRVRATVREPRGDVHTALVGQSLLHQPLASTHTHAHIHTHELLCCSHLYFSTDCRPVRGRVRAAVREPGGDALPVHPARVGQPLLHYWRRLVPLAQQGLLSGSAQDCLVQPGACLSKGRIVCSLPDLCF